MDLRDEYGNLNPEYNWNPFDKEDTEFSKFIINHESNFIKENRDGGKPKEVYVVEGYN